MMQQGVGAPMGQENDARPSGAALALALTIAALGIAAIGPAYLNHDAAWYLVMARRWLDGATLYRDVVDTNPPLIVWLSTPAVWIAGLAGIPATAVFKGFVMMLAAASVAAVRTTTRRAWPEHEYLIVIAAAFLCLPFAKNDFGQREHLAVLLTMPYIVAAAAPGTAARWRWTVGIAAGLGFAIKPHFLLAWLAVEGVGLATSGARQLRRPEALAAVATTTLYGLAVAIAVPQYFTVVGQVRQVYGALNSPASVLLRLREVQLWMVAAAAFAAVRWPLSSRLPGVAFAAATAFLLAALLQLKGWNYHLYPARVWTLFFFVVAAGTIVERLPSALALLRGGRRGLAVVFAGALIAMSVRYIAEARNPATADLVSPLAAAMQVYAPAAPVAVLSMRTIIYPAFPAVNYAGAVWRLRHNSLLFLSGFYQAQGLRAGGPLQPHTLDEMPPLERTFFDEVLDDLCAAPPRLLVIERAEASAPAGRRALDLQRYYRQSERGEHLLDAYEQRESIGPFTLFTPVRPPSCR